MPNLLKNLHLEELSLVDVPANAQAVVSLFKRDNSIEEITKMTREDMEKNIQSYMTEKACSREDAITKLEYDLEYAEGVALEANLQVAEMVAYEAEQLADITRIKEEDEKIQMELEEARLIEAQRQNNERLVSEVLAMEGNPNMTKTLKEENEFLRKGLISNGYIITKDEIKKKAEVETIEVSGEMIAKSDIPEVVLKALEAAKFEKADAELTKRATEALPNFDLEVAKTLMGKFSDDENVMKSLKAADSVFGSSMEELGKSNAETEYANSETKLEALVKSYMDENKMNKGDYHKAYAAIAKTDEGRSLINKRYKGE